MSENSKADLIKWLANLSDGYQVVGLHDDKVGIDFEILN